MYFPVLRYNILLFLLITLPLFPQTPGTFSLSPASLDNAEIGLKAVYYFRGGLPKEGKVTKGQQITTSTGKKMSIFANKTLLFSLFLIKGNKVNPIILNKEYFN